MQKLKRSKPTIIATVTRCLPVTCSSLADWRRCVHWPGIIAALETDKVPCCVTAVIWGIARLTAGETYAGANTAYRRANSPSHAGTCPPNWRALIEVRHADGVKIITTPSLSCTRKGLNLLSILLNFTKPLPCKTHYKFRITYLCVCCATLLIMAFNSAAEQLTNRL